MATPQSQQQLSTPVSEGESMANAQVQQGLVVPGNSDCHQVFVWIFNSAYREFFFSANQASAVTQMPPAHFSYHDINTVSFEGLAPHIKMSTGLALFQMVGCLFQF